jgi:hypothetical protein
MHAYFRYRDFYQSVSGRTTLEEEAERKKDEALLVSCCLGIEDQIQIMGQTFSLVIVNLFLKSVRFLIKQRIMTED